jgi:hypothetical protein
MNSARGNTYTSSFGYRLVLPHYRQWCSPLVLPLFRAWLGERKARNVVNVCLFARQILPHASGDVEAQEQQFGLSLIICIILPYSPLIVGNSCKEGIGMLIIIKGQVKVSASWTNFKHIWSSMLNWIAVFHILILFIDAVFYLYLFHIIA